jgi:hypothetical protein
VTPLANPQPAKVHLRVFIGLVGLVLRVFLAGGAGQKPASGFLWGV